MPDHDQIYDKQANMYEQLISKQDSLEGVIKEITQYRNLDVADLGAGSGRLAEFMAAAARSLICTDDSSAMLSVLEEKFKGSKFNNWSTVVSDHRKLPIESSTIDLAVSGWSLCYLASSNVPDWRTNLTSMMAEIHRILRPNGTIIILENFGTGSEEPNPPDFLKQYYRLLSEKYGFSHKWIRTDYTFDSVQEAVELTGFFFGDWLVEKVKQNNWSVVPECAGVWWKHV